MTVNARTEITPGETFIPVAPRLQGLTEYFVVARADNGVSRIVPVYFFNETSDSDHAVVAFARGSWGNSVSACSGDVARSVSADSAREVTTLISCALPQSLDIIPTNIEVGRPQAGIDLEPSSFSDFKVQDLRLNEGGSSIQVRSGCISDNAEILVLCRAGQAVKALLFDAGQDCKVALVDEMGSFSKNQVDAILSKLYPTVRSFVYREIVGNVLIAPSAVIQELREREALGVTSGEPTLLPQLTSFEKDKNSLTLTFQYGTTSFTVKGELHQLKSLLAPGEWRFIAAGPRPVDSQTEAWFQDQLRQILKTKLPEFDSKPLLVRYRDAMRSPGDPYPERSPDMDLEIRLCHGPTVERLNKSELVATFINDGQPFRFGVSLARTEGNQTSVTISGPNMGDISNSWVRDTVVRALKQQDSKLAIISIGYAVSE